MFSILKLSQYSFNVFALPPAFVGLMTGFLGIVAFIRQRGSISSLVFLLLSMSGMMWLLSYVGIYSAIHPAIALPWIKIESISVALIPSFFYLFALTAVHRLHEFRFLAIFSGIISFVFILTILFTDTFVSGVSRYSWGYYPQFGFTSLAFLGFFFVIMSVSLFLYWSYYQHSLLEQHKRRFKLLFFAFAIASFGAVDFLPAYGFEIYPFGYLPIFIFVLVVGEGMRRYHLMDITPAFAAEQIVQTIADALLVLDRNGHVQIANEKAQEIFEKSQKEILGKPITSIVPSSSLGKFDLFLQKGAVSDEEIILKNKNGNRILSFSASIMRDQNKEPMAVVCIAKDITRFKRSEEETRRSEEKTRQIIETSNDAFVGMDMSGEITDWNPQAEKIFGWMRSEVMGRDLAEVIIPEAEREAYAQGLKIFLNTGKGPILNKTIELKALHRSGHDFFIELTVWPLESSEGFIFYSFIRDITERKKTEETLRRKNMFVLLLQLIAVAANQAATIEEAIQICLAEVCAHTHWPVGHVYFWDPDSPDQLLSSSIWHIQDLKKFRGLQLVTQNTPLSRGKGLAGLVLASGQPVWIENLSEHPNFPRAKTSIDIGVKSGFAVPVMTGKEIVAVLEFFSDKTMPPDEPLLEVMSHIGAQIGRVIERTQAEELLKNAYGEMEKRVLARTTELSQERNFVTAILDTAGALVIVLDHEGKIVHFNRTCEEITGYQRKEVCGKHLWDPVLKLNEEKLLKGIFEKMQTDATSKKFDSFLRAKNGSRHLITWSLTMLKTKANFVTNVIATGIDITERKQMEENLQRIADDLKRSNHELEQFAYVASHDLQEPLRMVASYTQLLKKRYEGKLGSDADDFIRFAAEGAVRAQVLIADLLEYSRVGTRAKTFEPVDLEIALERSLSNLNLVLQDSQAEVTHDPLPTVLADNMQCVQLFQNLVANAVKFHGKEMPKVHVSALKNNRDCIISIQDNGIGIEAQYAERIFVIFQRLHTRDEYPGTGIGLAVCKKIVERHDGKIWVESKSGQGATFFFTLPLLK